MIERPPKFGSKHFWDYLTPAFRGDPVMALVGLYWMATRRRVRGWARLMIAVASAPVNYARWIRHGEARALADFRRSHSAGKNGKSVIVLLIGEATDAGIADSLASVRAALGTAVPVYSTRGGLDGIRSLAGATNDLSSVLTELDLEHGSAWLLPLQAGDRLSPQLCDVLQRFDEGDASIIYWDEDSIEGSKRSGPWVKPDWDALLFGRLGGLVGASIARLSVAAKAARSMGNQAVDVPDIERLIMDGIAVVPGTPAHIPLILTHRSRNPIRQRSCRALTNEPTNWPSVSIIVPTRDKPELLAACLSGIERTAYPGELETIVVDNGSCDPAAIRILNQLESNPRARLVRDDSPFNFSRLNNQAARIARGDVLCLLNNDVEPLDATWLTGLVPYVLNEDVGAVGAQLLYPSGRIQHAGVAIGIGGAAGHVQKGVDPADQRFWTWHAVTRQVSAVTAAVMVVRESVFAEVGGFDEDFAVAFNDVDFCLRLKQRGLRNIYVADVRLIHRESESRGQDRTPEQVSRFASELAQLQERWGTEDYSDPHFSPLFSRLVERCVLRP